MHNDMVCLIVIDVRHRYKKRALSLQFEGTIGVLTRLTCAGMSAWELWSASWALYSERFNFGTVFQVLGGDWSWSINSINPLHIIETQKLKMYSACPLLFAGLPTSDVAVSPDAGVMFATIFRLPLVPVYPLVWWVPGLKQPKREVYL
jgi:hypothetical protein